MQKVTAFLEQNVQWLAIGLGALFCLYMTYSYVITPPAQATMSDGTVLGPSEVDPHTADTVAAKLSSAMTSSGRIKIDVPQYVQGFSDTMTWKNAKPIELVDMTDPANRLDVQVPTAQPPPGTPGVAQQQPGVVPPGGVQPPVAVAKITKLPVPPTPKYDVDNGLKYGRSVVIPLPQPGQPAPPPPAPGVVPPNAIDKDWVTQMWKVSMPELDQAWRTAGLTSPALQGLNTTVFLNVEMVREEMVDGKWGNETVIPPLDVMRNAQPRMPNPPAGVANKGQQFAYIMWAAQNTPDIIQPLFHNTVPGKGDQWTKPGQQILALAFDPTTFKGDVNALPADQKKAVLDYRQQQYKLLQEQKKQNRPAPRAPGGGRGTPPDMMEGGGANYAPRRGAPSSYAPIRDRAGAGEQLPHYALPPRVPPYPIRPGYGGPPDEMDGGEGGFGGYGGYGAPQAPGLPAPGTDYPTGEFNPADATSPPLQWKAKDVEIWVHDDQVVAGKTYRYKMRYSLKNPIFGAGNIAEPKELSDEFALVSPWSEWTTQITVPSLVNFFIAGGGIGNRKTVAFEIFRWDQGQQKAERFDLGPGDPVGWNKNGIDFTTDWTVVDFREDPRTNDAQILLLNNADGRVIARSFGADRNDKLYNALKKQVADAKLAEQAAQGIAPAGNGTAAAR